ncbi:hypothetical protein AWI43_26705 [Streptomyces sp. WAC04657]|nr:hypothetical protein AWI43_26705 [Streptomyces sp. WAC04657]
MRWARAWSRWWTQCSARAGSRTSSIASDRAQTAAQTVRRPGTCTGRAAPAVATIAVPITEAYQWGPRCRTERTRGPGRTPGVVARGTGRGVGRRGATLAMTPPSSRSRARTRDHAAMTP